MKKRKKKIKESKSDQEWLEARQKGTVCFLRRECLSKNSKEVRNLGSGALGIPGRENSQCKGPGAQPAWQLERQQGARCVWCGWAMRGVEARDVRTGGNGEGPQRPS